jgi:hypothetical protein
MTSADERDKQVLNRHLLDGMQEVAAAATIPSGRPIQAL